MSKPLALWPKLLGEAAVRQVIRDEMGYASEEVALIVPSRFYLLSRGRSINGRYIEIKPLNLRRAYREPSA